MHLGYKSSTDKQLIIGHDGTNNALYFSPDNNTTKYFPLEKLCVRSVLLASTSLVTDLPIWLNKTGRTMVVESVTIRAKTKPSGACTININQQTSGTGTIAAGTNILQAADIDLNAVLTNDTNYSAPLHATAANAEVPDGSIVGFELVGGATTALACCIVEIVMRPKVTAQSLPNTPA